MSEAYDRFLQHRIREEWQWMQDNYEEDITERDALDHLLQECGQTDDGDCLHAGSEYCDFDCPFRDEPVDEDDATPTAGRGGGRVMSRLDVLDDALIALARCLHAHGPACVCVPCRALTASQALLPRLAHVLVVLEAWSADVDGEPYLAQDLGLLLTLLDDRSTTRPAAPPHAGEEGENKGACSLENAE
jgi:hypothetical protein